MSRRIIKGRCDGKVRFAKRAHAEAAMEHPAVKAKRAYRCPDCGGFHLTSKLQVAQP